jgi:Icc-related predicted phosphoesterase
VNLDGRIVEVAGLRIGGLGGSIRYSEGPNQYTQAQMRRRARKLGLRARLRGGLDVLITHGAPLGVSDEDDPCHLGFAAFHRLVANARPKVLLHGHIHPHGEVRPDRAMGDTRVVNVIPFRLIEVQR